MPSLTQTPLLAVHKDGHSLSSNKMCTSVPSVLWNSSDWMLTASIYCRGLPSPERAPSQCLYRLLSAQRVCPAETGASVSLINSKPVDSLRVTIHWTCAMSNELCKVAEHPEVMKSHQTDRGCDAFKGLV